MWYTLLPVPHPHIYLYNALQCSVLSVFSCCLTFSTTPCMCTFNLFNETLSSVVRQTLTTCERTVR